MSEAEISVRTANYLAIDLLEMLGNEHPSQEHIDLAESFLLKMTVAQNLDFDIRLTARERTCLLLAALGRTSTETALLLKIKKSTVDTHRSQIKRKLACNSLAQAVFEGIRYGELPLVQLENDRQAQEMV